MLAHLKNSLDFRAGWLGLDLCRRGADRAVKKSFELEIVRFATNLPIDIDGWVFVGYRGRI